MYGTIFRMKVKPGHEADVIEVFKEWETSRRPRVTGAIAGLLLRPDSGSGELVGVAIFSDKEAYSANAEDPEQDRWYRKLRGLLEADPTWEDGEFVAGGVG